MGLGPSTIQIYVPQLRELDGFTVQVEEFVGHVKNTELGAGTETNSRPWRRSLAGDKFPADRPISENQAPWEAPARIAAKPKPDMPTGAS